LFALVSLLWLHRHSSSNEVSATALCRHHCILYIGIARNYNIHAANSNYFFTNPATGQKPPVEEDPKSDQFKTKAAVVEFVKKAFADGAAAIQGKGDEGIANVVTEPGGHRQIRLIDLAYGLIEHSGEHYGQLVVYYRIAGLVPPESRPKK
jgi:hypothetical protein